MKLAFRSLRILGVILLAIALPLLSSALIPEQGINFGRFSTAEGGVGYYKILPTNVIFSTTLGFILASIGTALILVARQLRKNGK